MDQMLLDVQMPLLEKVIEAAGPGQNTLVASGDVLILPGELPFKLPAADVVCLGMWADPHLASRHGVFFAKRAMTIGFRIVMAVAAFVVLFHPNETVALMLSVVILPVTVYGVLRHRRFAPPKVESQSQPQLQPVS